MNSLDQAGDDFKNNAVDCRGQRVVVRHEMNAVADDGGVEDDHEGFHCVTCCCLIVMFYTVLQAMSTKKSAEALFFCTFFLCFTSETCP